MKALGNVFIVALSIPVSLLQGLVLSWMWRWFLVPLGVPSIGIVQACGIGLVASIFAHQKAPKDPEADDSFTGLFMRVVSRTVEILVIWGIAWCWHKFM